MEVHFTPEQEARISQAAATTGTDPETIVKDATMRLLEEDTRFRVDVREQVSQGDHGRFIEESEVDDAVKRILELQRHVKPDLEGWTMKEYINYGRR